MYSKNNYLNTVNCHVSCNVRSYIIIKVTTWYPAFHLLLFSQKNNVTDPGSTMDTIFVLFFMILPVVYGQPGVNPLPGKLTTYK